MSIADMTPDLFESAAPGVQNISRLTSHGMAADLQALTAIQSALLAMVIADPLAEHAAML